MAESWQDYLMRITGADGGLWAMLRATIQLESAGNPNATNTNTNGSIDRGLLQLNSTYWSGKYTPLQQFNPIVNLQAGTPELIRAYKAGQAQGLAGFPLIQYAWKHGGHPALLTRTDGRRVWESFDGFNTPAGTANVNAVLGGGALPTTPDLAPPDLAPDAQARQVEQIPAGSVWGWLTGDFSQIRPAVQLAGWNVAGALGGVLLIILGVVLLGATMRGAQ